jgi:hypothetical protein
MGVHIQILLGDRMGSDNHFDSVSFFKKSFEHINMGAGGITDDQTGRQMNHLRAILNHFITGIFDVAAGTPVAGRITDQLDFSVRVYAEGSFPVAQRAETLSACAAAVAIADNYSDFCLLTHFNSFQSLTIKCTRHPDRAILTAAILFLSISKQGMSVKLKNPPEKVRPDDFF